MKKAFELAKKGKGKTYPNPTVGCVIVRKGKIVGQGFTQPAGQNHAEIEALNSCKQSLEKAEMYSTLEPCSHFGKTPPCTKAIIKSGISRVVIGSIDSNPLVNGKGVQELLEAGIKVEIQENEEIKKLNEDFFKFILTKKPFIILKAAISLDGKICSETGDSKWISGEDSRKKVHKMRSECNAILVGIKTVLKDNPQLTARIPEGRNPLRIILDSSLKIPLQANVLSDSNVLIICSKKVQEKKLKKLKRKEIQVMQVNELNGKLDLNELLKVLGEKGIVSLLVEGGSEVFSSFIAEKLVDKIVLFVAPKIIGGKNSKSFVEGKGIQKISEALTVQEMSVEKSGEDLLIQGYLK